MKTKKAIEIIKETYCIEYGGCGIAALALYRFLRKKSSKDNIKFIFCYITKQKKDFLNNKNSLSFEGDIKIPAHVMLIKNGEIIDPSGNFSITKFKYFQIIENEDFIIKSINTTGWNNLFYRGYAIDMSKALRINLSDINLNQ